MDPKLLSADAKPPSKDYRLRIRQLGRIVGLAWPHRGKLALGLVFTVLFAGLHTASLGGAFPVFKLLLEDEGLQGWMDRTLAGQRLGVRMTPPADERSVRVVSVDDSQRSAATGLRQDDVLTDPAGGEIAAWLNDVAHEEEGATIEVQVTRPTGEQRLAQVVLDRSAMSVGDRLRRRLMRTAASWIPADAHTSEGRLRVLSRLLIGLVLVVIAANVCRYFGEVLIAYAVLHSMMRLRTRLYERTLQLPMSFFGQQPTADLVTRFVQDIQEIQRGMLTVFGKFIREPLKAIFILGLAFVLDWRITLTMIIVTPMAVTMFLLVGRSVKKANRKLLQAYGMMIGALTTSLQNLRVVKAYTAEDHERDHLRRVDLRMLKQQYKLAKLQAFVSPMMETMAILAGSLLTVWLASRVLHDHLETSKFVTLGVVLTMLFDPLRKLSDVYVRVQRSTAGAERIFQVMDEPVEKDLTEARQQLGPLGQAIEYADVTFTYPGAGEPALRNIDLHIGQGETLAIVGPNGCGKTTLVSMLPRFFDPDSGVIRYDGVDIREADLKSLRKQIGLVSQEAIVFSGTPLENIVYGMASPDSAAAQEAAQRAYADEFIRKIPGGYEADLGERGTTLSGGQRQRLAIARAIFRNAPILIFDEATSQIDTESELKIQNALAEFAQGRTTLIIAHRLSTIQFADRIAVMEAGRIIDAGTHGELFDRCGLYRTLCETQFVNDHGGR